MMFRIAVVDGDETDSDTIKQYLERYSNETGDRFKIDFFHDGDEISSDYEPRFDIIFSEVQLKRLGGLAAAERIRAFDDEVRIVFIAHSDEYAIKGYSVQASGFLLKPVSYAVFSAQLKNLLKKIAQPGAKSLLLPASGGIARVNIKDIVYIESIKHKIYVYTRAEKYGLTATLKNFETQLAPYNFFQVNSGYLVNLAYITSVSENVIAAGGFNLSLSRSRKKPFLKALADFSGEPFPKIE